MTMVVGIVVRLVFMYCSVMVSGSVQKLAVILVLLNVIRFLSLGVYLCIVSVCGGCSGYAFCLICDVCS